MDVMTKLHECRGLQMENSSVNPNSLHRTLSLLYLCIYVYMATTHDFLSMLWFLIFQCNSCKTQSCSLAGITMCMSHKTQSSSKVSTACLSQYGFSASSILSGQPCLVLEKMHCHWCLQWRNLTNTFMNVSSCILHDHKPLTKILGPKRGILPLTAAWLQGWVLQPASTPAQDSVSSYFSCKCWCIITSSTMVETKSGHSGHILSGSGGTDPF